MRNSLFGEKIDLATRLDPNELWRRITATSDAKKFTFLVASRFAGDKRFLHTVCGSEIKVNLRERRKGIPPILTMKIVPNADGCRIVGVIAVEKSTWMFFAAMLAVFVAIGAPPIYTVIGNWLAGQPLQSFTPFDFFACVFLVNALALPVTVFFKVRHDTNELIGWLENLIAGVVIKTGDFERCESSGTTVY